MSHDEFEHEPVPGLPAQPPEGETILWQGKPEWMNVARRVFHMGLIGAYLALWIVWRVARQVADGSGWQPALAHALVPALLSAAALAILAVLSWGVARTTVYTVTSRRVAMRFGIALPVTFNLPFTAIASADVRRFGRGHGDIALQLDGGARIAFLILWPHVRPWRLKLPQPMLRCVPNVDGVAAVLAQAIAADAPRIASGAVVIEKRAPDPTSIPEPRLIAAE